MGQRRSPRHAQRGIPGRRRVSGTKTSPRVRTSALPSIPPGGRPAPNDVASAGSATATIDAGSRPSASAAAGSR